MNEPLAPCATAREASLRSIRAMQHAMWPSRLLIAALVALAPLTVAAQTLPATDAAEGPAAPELDAVEVIGLRRPLSQFPGAVTVIGGETLRDGQRQVDVSESLSRVPGLSALDRQNYAQDVQLQSRGFGARSTFGIRGIKLVVDGIPASFPDGQGQAANFPLGALDRIEVLRGPLALQYGNAAGGAIVGHTDLDGPPGLGGEAWIGSHDSRRLGLRADGGRRDGDGRDLRWRLQGSHFSTEGSRRHAAAQRSQLHAVTQWTPRSGGNVRLVANSLWQPLSQDPLGLTRGELAADPHGTTAVALQFDTRKTITNHQLGLRWQDDYAPGRSAWAGGHHIARDVLQYLAIPPGAQLAPGSSGGVIDLARDASGIDIGHRWHGARGAFAVGLEAGRLHEQRRGYENFVGDVLGVRGRLRRDERNTVDNREVYAVGDLRPTAEWTLLAAARHARLAFASDDRYVAPGNADDSGALDFSETTMALGVARAFARGEVFAGIGRGFETPTVTELAYRPGGEPGFNAALSPARFVTAELGTRWRHATGSASAALYRVEGDDEIVPAESRGGRASFANAGRTRREGLEASIDGALGARWRYAITANWIVARFVEDFAYRVVTPGGSSDRVVLAGNRVPGIPRADGYAELAWSGRGDRLSAAVEARASDRIAVDDLNTDAAAGNARLALRMRWTAPARSGWHAFARIDNLLDRRYVGSVIVNDGNRRFFEPGPARTFTLGIGWNSPAR